MARTMSFFIFGILILESRLCSGLGNLTPVKGSETALIHDTMLVNYSPNSFRTFQEVIDRFDYLKDMHVDAIWLSSIFPRSDDLSVTNYMDVHQGFGNMADFERLLEGAHKHGIKVTLTVMPYETSDQHLWFRQWRKNGSPYNKFYVTREEKPPRESNGWSDERQIGYLQKFPHTPCLDLSNPEVRHRLNKEIFEFWLNKGVDGFMIEGLWQYAASSEEVFPYSEAIVENNKGYLQKVRMFIDHWTIKHNSTYKYLGARASEAKDTQAVYYRTKDSSGARSDETAKLTTLFLDLKDQPDITLTSDTKETLRAVNATRQNPSPSSPGASMVRRSLRAKRDAPAVKEKKTCCNKGHCNAFQKALEWMKEKWEKLCHSVTSGFDNLKEKFGKKN